MHVLNSFDQTPLHLVLKRDWLELSNIESRSSSTSNLDHDPIFPDEPYYGEMPNQANVLDNHHTADQDLIEDPAQMLNSTLKEELVGRKATFG